MPSGLKHTIIVLGGCAFTETLNEIGSFPHPVQEPIRLLLRIGLAYLAYMNLYRNPDGTPAAEPTNPSANTPKTPAI